MHACMARSARAGICSDVTFVHAQELGHDASERDPRFAVAADGSDYIVRARDSLCVCVSVSVHMMCE